VVVVAVDQGDVRVGAGERFDRAQPTKAAADDDDSVCGILSDHRTTVATRSVR
jgi:hypothetical protein